MEIDEKYLDEGVEKQVFIDKEGYVVKIFKVGRKPLPYEEQLRIIELKKNYLGEYMPDTFLYKTGLGDTDYYIKQKYILGKQIKDINISDLSDSALRNLGNLLERYMLYCNKEGKYIDAFGYQKQYQDLSPWQRRTKLLLKIYKNFLNSSNIIITDDDQVFYIDITESGPHPDYCRFKNFLIKPFLSLTLKKIKQLSSKKMQIGKSTKANLHQTLK